MAKILELKNSAKLEVYSLIDHHLRKLPRDKNGHFDEFQEGYVDNDVDALRHAYVSGAYTMEYGSEVAELLGRLNELFNLNYSQNSSNSQNMDLWNNSVGRKYGKRAKDRSELFQNLLKALRNGELIISLEDNRKYKGSSHYKKIPKSVVIKIKENKTGANILFYDISQNVVMTKDEFVTLIKSGKYPKYSIKIVDGNEIPFSKRDRFKFNNLR